MGVRLVEKYKSGSTETCMFNALIALKLFIPFCLYSSLLLPSVQSVLLSNECD